MTLDANTSLEKAGLENAAGWELTLGLAATHTFMAWLHSNYSSDRAKATLSLSPIRAARAHL